MLVMSLDGDSLFVKNLLNDNMKTSGKEELMGAYRY